jgi:hypothetical protein
MEQLIEQGLQTSREALARARDKAQELGEAGLLRYELAQLEKRAQQLFGRLGVAVFDRLSAGGQDTVSREAVKELVAELEEIRKKIRQKEDDLQALR